ITITVIKQKSKGKSLLSLLARFIEILLRFTTEPLSVKDCPSYDGRTRSHTLQHNQSKKARENPCFLGGAP
ncbi:MAG: hypothetical protein IJ938_04815, partial [Clostridia bacterium]|nr:hypothetical protein [Clostridia bacterium]